MTERGCEAPQATPAPAHPASPPSNLVELSPGDTAALEVLEAGTVVVKDLLGQEEVVVLEKPLSGLHLRHELQIQCITHLLPGHPLGHHKGHPVL